MHGSVRRAAEVAIGMVLALASAPPVPAAAKPVPPVVTAAVQVSQDPNPARAHAMGQITRNPKTGTLIVAAEVLAAGVVRHPLHPSGGSRPSRRADEYTLGQGLPRAHPDPHARPSTRLRIKLTHAWPSQVSTSNPGAPASG